MRHILITAFFSTVFSVNGAFAQSRSHIIETDLYFRYLDVFRFFDIEPKKLKKLERYMTSFDLKKAKDDTALVVHFRKAMKDSLIRQPYVYVKNDTADFHLFLSPQDYASFKNYNFDNLESRHKKIAIKAEVKEVEYFGEKAYRCVSLISVREIDGETYNNKSHLYRHSDDESPKDTLK